MSAELRKTITLDKEIVSTLSVLIYRKSQISNQVRGIPKSNCIFISVDVEFNSCPLSSKNQPNFIDFFL